MIQSTLDFLRGDALGEEIKRVDIAMILRRFAIASSTAVTMSRCAGKLTRRFHAG